MNRIITIGREFGSGGRELGRRLSENLKIAYYDQEIVSEIAKRTELTEQYVQQIVSHRPITPLPIRVGRSFHSIQSPVVSYQNTIYQEQCKILQEMAEKSDCVIVGRCADYILREKNPFRIFVYADMESKIVRCRQREDRDISDQKIRKNILNINKNRANYYSYYTGRSWGDRNCYDLCINTTNTDIKEVAHVIAKLFSE